MISLALIPILVAAGLNPYADLLEPPIDSSTAYYEGRELGYVFPAPPRFRLVIEEAAATDGYSFAFISDTAGYAGADVIIGVTILANHDEETTPPPLEEFLTLDTAGMRSFYGEALKMWPVDSVLNRGRELLPSVYLTADREHIPTVMVSYYDGGTEVIVFELIVSGRFASFKALPIYEKAVGRFHVLKRATLEARDP